MKREENVKIYEDTRAWCESNTILKESIRKSISGQRVIYEKDEVKTTPGHRYTEKANVIVSQKRSFEAAANYKGQKICVHNFASATTPGGGVRKGSRAQEECLCRISTLHFCLDTEEMWERFYTPHRRELGDIHNGDCIYTPGVVVIKTDTDQPERMPEEDWYTVDVITLAAPKLKEGTWIGERPQGAVDKELITDAELLEIHKARLRRLFELAKANEEEVLILGAFGCGAYNNPACVVAEAMLNVVKEYEFDFRTIEFAVYCLPEESFNYRTFQRFFKPHLARREKKSIEVYTYDLSDKCGRIVQFEKSLIDRYAETIMPNEEVDEEFIQQMIMHYSQRECNDEVLSYRIALAMAEELSESENLDFFSQEEIDALLNGMQITDQEKGK